MSRKKFMTFRADCYNSAGVIISQISARTAEECLMHVAARSMTVDGFFFHAATGIEVLSSGAERICWQLQVGGV